MAGFKATDEKLKMQYQPLLREIVHSLFSLLDDINFREHGGTVLNSFDFYHLFDFMWNPNSKPDDPLLARNLWTFKNLSESQPLAGLNLVASRGTVLEICDSLQHEIERLSRLRKNPSMLGDIRKRFAQLEKNSMTLDSFEYSYVKEIKYFEKILPMLGSRPEGVTKVRKMFEDRKIQSYYDFIDEAEISKLRPKIKDMAGKIISSQKKYHRNRESDRNPADDELHRNIDAMNLAIARVLSENITQVKCNHITPYSNFTHSGMEPVRRSIYALSFFALAAVTGEKADGNMDYPDPKYIHYLAQKTQDLLVQLLESKEIPEYLFDEFTHVRKITVSVFYKDKDMHTERSFDSRRKLLMMESSDEEVFDEIEKVAENYESTARAVLSSEAHNIQLGGLLYDCDLIDNERAQYLMKKYG